MENILIMTKKIIFEMRVIEIQHRGLPHAHAVKTLSYLPEYSTEDGIDNIHNKKKLLIGLIKNIK